MSAEEENVKVLREGYDLWNESKARSAAYWMDLISDDVHWRSLADGAVGVEFTNARTSKQGVQDYSEQLTRDWEMPNFQAEEFVAHGDRVVMLGRCAWKNRKTGKALDTPKADVFRFRDGKIVDFMEFYDTAAAIAAAI
jgi:hypothetical protein